MRKSKLLNVKKKNKRTSNLSEEDDYRSQEESDEESQYAGEGEEEEEREIFNDEDQYDKENKAPLHNRVKSGNMGKGSCRPIALADKF